MCRSTQVLMFFSETHVRSGCRSEHSRDGRVLDEKMLCHESIRASCRTKLVPVLHTLFYGRIRYFTQRHKGQSAVFHKRIFKCIFLINLPKRFYFEWLFTEISAIGVELERKNKHNVKMTILGDVSFRTSVAVCLSGCA